MYKVTHPKHEITKTYTVTLIRRHNEGRGRETRKRCRNRRLYNKTSEGQNTKNRQRKKHFKIRNNNT